MKDNDFRSELVVCATEEEIGLRCADMIIDEIRRKPSLLLCAATGSSPLLTYRLLAEKKKEEPTFFDKLRVIKLDEWLGLEMTDLATCESYLRKYFIEPLDVTEDRYFSFASRPPDPLNECRKIRRILKEQGPIDLCLLGIGTNGHLGMNEPAEELTCGPHLAKLSQVTQQHTMIKDISVPIRFGITLGILDLMCSKRILLLMQGAQKREVVRRFLSGGISTILPASLLRLHGEVTYLCHQELLPETER